MFARSFQLYQRTGKWHSPPTDQPNYYCRTTLADPKYAGMDETERQVFHKMNQSHVQEVVYHFESDLDAIFQPNVSNILLLSNIRAEAFKVSYLYCSVKPFKSKNRDEIFLNATKQNLKKSCSGKS